MKYRLDTMFFVFAVFTVHPIHDDDALSTGWSSLSEAVSYGDRQTILCLLRKLKSQSREALEARRPDLIQALTDMGDFYMELKWDFQSWVPFLSRILPSDVCKIHKKGSSMR